MYAFAKPIDGGFQIVNYDEQPYYVEEIPEFCYNTGRTVIADEDSANLILDIAQRCDELLGLLNDKIGSILSEFVSKIDPRPLEEIDRAQQVAMLARIYAASRIPCVLQEKSAAGDELADQFEDCADSAIEQLTSQLELAVIKK